MIKRFIKRNNFLIAVLTILSLITAATSAFKLYILEAIAYLLLLTFILFQDRIADYIFGKEVVTEEEINKYIEECNKK